MGSTGCSRARAGNRAGCAGHGLRAVGRDRPDPDLQLHFTPVGYKLTPKELIILKDPVVTAIPNVSRPESRGHLGLRSGDFREPPRIFSRLLDAESDIRRSSPAAARFARFSRHPRWRSM